MDPMTRACQVSDGIIERLNEVRKIYDIKTPLSSIEITRKEDEVLLSVNIPEANSLSEKLPEYFIGYPRIVARKIFPLLEGILPRK